MMFFLLLCCLSLLSGVLMSLRSNDYSYVRPVNSRGCLLLNISVHSRCGYFASRSVFIFFVGFEYRLGADYGHCFSLQMPACGGAPYNPKSATKVLLFWRKCKNFVILFDFFGGEGEGIREREWRIGCRRN